MALRFGCERACMTSLAGLLILDCSRVLAGPYCAQILGDLGATVIKLEAPSGDETRQWGPPFVEGESTYFWAANRNKRSITLDVSQAAGQQIFMQLAARSAVLLDNYKVGTLERWGLDDEALWQHNPKLVHTTISAYGSAGPRATAPGYDLLLQAFGGLMSITGEPEGAPMKTGVALVDVLTGLYAAIATLAAVRHADATGQGQRVACALLDAAVAALVNVGTAFLATGTAPQRWGNAHATIVPYQLFQASDAPLLLAVGNDGQWRRCCAVLEHPAWANDPRFSTNPDRVAHRAALVAEIAVVLAQHSAASWLERFAAAGVPAAPVNTLPALFADPQTQHQQLQLPIEHSTAGSINLLGFPYKLSHTPAAITAPPPLLGEHTDAILSELGYTTADIARLHAEGIV